MINTQPCTGIFGKLFGHKFKAVYDTTDTPVYNTNTLPYNFDIAEIIRAAKADALCTDAPEIVQSVIENLPSHIKVNYEETSTYRGHVCVRCGLTVNEP
jgi:hypothetical protein